MEVFRIFARTKPTARLFARRLLASLFVYGGRQRDCAALVDDEVLFTRHICAVSQFAVVSIVRVCHRSSLGSFMNYLRQACKASLLDTLSRRFEYGRRV